MKKINYNLLCKILVISVLTFFSGYFLPENYLSDQTKIFEMLITIFGVALTVFTFIQGIVQNCKSSFLVSVKKEQSYLIQKFEGLDAIVKELKGDVWGLLLIPLVFGSIMLFFSHIDNSRWQEFLIYFKYFIIFLTVFLVVDIVLTMFKLIEINATLNIIAVREREEPKNKE